MTTADDRLYPPLYGLMQNYMGAYANGLEPPAGEPRGVVELEDALDAVMQATAVIDQFTQSGDIPTDRGMHAAASLMVLREYVRPAPPSEEDGIDLLAEDLKQIVEAQRASRAAYAPPADGTP